MGFVLHPGSYLRSAWCQLDFTIVTLAWLPILLPDAGNFSAIRTLRALRPLRALKVVPGMPVLIESLFRAVPYACYHRLLPPAAATGCCHRLLPSRAHGP